MQSIPLEFLAQLRPLIFVSGLGTESQPPPSTLSQGPGQDSPFSSLVGSLRSVLLGSSISGSGASGASSGRKDKAGAGEIYENVHESMKRRGELEWNTVLVDKVILRFLLLFISGQEKINANITILSFLS